MNKIIFIIALLCFINVLSFNAGVLLLVDFLIRFGIKCIIAGGIVAVFYALTLNCVIKNKGIRA